MKVLVFNGGSSTLKVQLFEASNQIQPTSLASCLVERIGQQGLVRLETAGGGTSEEPANVSNHAQAALTALDRMKSARLFDSGGPDAIGHRVVHGGERFRESVAINDDVLNAIEEVTQLAPLHNGPSLEAIKAVRGSVGATVPAVAVFDTAFHRTMPEKASSYAIPYGLASRHHLQRYGFHGIAHRYMAERAAAILGKQTDAVKLITLQLGNGCSACAISSGRSVDTSMGLTPLEGLVMGTRSGDVDPSLPLILAQREGVPVDEVEQWLNHRSGLLGVSGSSQDMRELLQAEQEGDKRAALAIEMFCYRIRKYVGAYLSVLGGADAVVFGGGIGENAPAVRERVCSGMEWCGLALDVERNCSASGVEAEIQAGSSTMRVLVVPVDEASVIVHETIRCLGAQ